MRTAVDSTNRTPKDYFHIALTSFGVVLGVAGIIIVSWRTVGCGLALIFFGLAYFALED